MNYDYYYGDYYNGFYSPSFGAIAAVGIVAVIAAIVGVIMYFTFFNKNNEGKYTGKKEKLYNFMNFNKFFLEDLMRLIYIVSVFVVTAMGIALIVVGQFSTGALLLILGNISLRVSFELIMMFIIMCKKTVAMDKKLEGIAKYYDDGYDEYCPEPEKEEKNNMSSWEAELSEAMSCDGFCGACSSDCDSREEETEF